MFDVSIIFNVIAITGLLLPIVILFLSLNERTRSNKYYWIALGLTIMFACSITYLWPSILGLLSLLLSKSDAASALSLAVFSVITSVLVAYSLYALSDFDKKKQEILDNIADVKSKIGSMDDLKEKVDELDTQKSKNEIGYLYIKEKTASYLKITHEINDDDGSNHQRGLALKQIRALVSGNSAKTILKELVEIEAVLNSNPDEIIPVLKSHAKEFLNCLIRLIESGQPLSVAEEVGYAETEKKISSYASLLLQKIDLH